MAVHDVVEDLRQYCFSPAVEDVLVLLQFRMGGKEAGGRVEVDHRGPMLGGERGVQGPGSTAVRARSTLGVQRHCSAGNRVNALAGQMTTGVPGRSRAGGRHTGPEPLIWCF